MLLSWACRPQACGARQLLSAPARRLPLKPSSARSAAAAAVCARLQELFPLMNRLAGLPADTALDVYEEVKFEPTVGGWVGGWAGGRGAVLAEAVVLPTSGGGGGVPEPAWRILAHCDSTRLLGAQVPAKLVRAACKSCYAASSCTQCPTCCAVPCCAALCCR